MIKLGLSILISLALPGCTGQSWTKPGATKENVAQDRYDCQREATSQKRYSGAFFSETLFRQCMEARGYSSQREP